MYTDYRYKIVETSTYAILKEDAVVSNGNEIVIPSSGETSVDIARASWIAQKGIILGSDLNIIRPTSSVYPLFLALSLSNNQVKYNLAKVAQGNSIVHLYNNNLKKVNIYFPNIVEQNKIGNILNSISNCINLHERKCEELTLIKKALLQKLFPKKEEVRPEVRYKNFSDAWEQRKLGEVVNFLDTLRKPLEGAKRVKGPYPYYGASGIVDYVDGYLFDEELILLSEDGANITERNYPVCFLASGKYWVNNHAHVLKIKEDNDNNFICNSLERKDYTKYNTGMAMPKLNKETCKGIPIMCPNYDEQKKIGNYFRKFDTLIALHQRKLEKLKQLKKFLLQNMFI